MTRHRAAAVLPQAAARPSHVFLAAHSAYELRLWPRLSATYIEIPSHPFAPILTVTLHPNMMPHVILWCLGEQVVEAVIVPVFVAVMDLPTARNIAVPRTPHLAVKHLRRPALELTNVVFAVQPIAFAPKLLNLR
jgi:hypothetical protein